MGPFELGLAFNEAQKFSPNTINAIMKGEWVVGQKKQKCADVV